MSREPGFYPDIPELAYHDDRDSLSHSGAKTILRSPALFKHQLDKPEHKAAFDEGSAAHALVLGRGMEAIYVAPFEDWTKRKGPDGGTQYTTDERRIAREDGLSPILPKDWLRVCDMADELSKHSLAMELLSKGDPEVSAYAEDETTGVMLRCRFDYLAEIIVDYKTAITADPGAFGRNAAKYGYHSQAGWYLDLARVLDYEARGFVFVVQEKTAPYLVSVVELHPDAIDRGRELNRRAIDTYLKCATDNEWPGYPEQIVSVDIPRWAYTDDHHYDEETEEVA